MPAIRSSQTKVPVTGKENIGLSLHPDKLNVNNRNNDQNAAEGREIETNGNSNVVDLALQSKDQVYFPRTETERTLFRTDGGKKLTSHQWAVYDLTQQIPCGKVTTYKYLCAKLGEGSPRSVGSALRNNPFAPFVPCHRVIASDLSLGGFVGEWGTQNEEGSHCSRKVEMLAKEGVNFGKDGKLVDKDQVVWK